tara:strand:- start:651 stop:812 length:162 start_codon:yes stop_codon:yes gene_type:complete
MERKLNMEYLIAEKCPRCGKEGCTCTPETCTCQPKSMVEDKETRPDIIESFEE